MGAVIADTGQGTAKPVPNKWSSSAAPDIDTGASTIWATAATTDTALFEDANWPSKSDGTNKRLWFNAATAFGTAEGNVALRGGDYFAWAFK